MAPPRTVFSWRSAAPGAKLPNQDGLQSRAAVYIAQSSLEIIRLGSIS
jgi:hypothetical protein